MAAAESGILIDEATKDAGKSARHIRFVKKDEIRVKGKSNLIPVFVPSRVLGRVSDRQFNVLDPIVGRRAEKDLIRRSIDRLQAEGRKLQTRVLCIEGDAGVGKVIICPSSHVQSKLVDHTVFSFHELDQKVFIGNLSKRFDSYQKEAPTKWNILNRITRGKTFSPKD